MYNGSRKVKGEAIHGKKCWKYRGSEQGKGGGSKRGIGKEKLRGYFGKMNGVSGRRESRRIVT